MSTADVATPIQIRRASPREDGALALLAQLDRYLTSLYPPEANYLFSVEALCAPESSFYVAEVDGQAIGCAAVITYEGYAEVKRVFVHPRYRRSGVAQQLMMTLDERARELGFGKLLLECGIHQTRALAFYARHGFVRRGPFGDYPDIPLSVFMEKALV